MNGEIIAIIAIITLAAVIGYQGWVNHQQRKQFNEMERELLNRIMARNYEVLVQGDVAREQIKNSLTPEEIYDMQQERGIPV